MSGQESTDALKDYFIQGNNYLFIYLFKKTLILKLYFGTFPLSSHLTHVQTGVSLLVL